MVGNKEDTENERQLQTMISMRFVTVVAFTDPPIVTGNVNLTPPPPRTTRPTATTTVSTTITTKQPRFSWSTVRSTITSKSK